jgi:hypothetical protein
MEGPKRELVGLAVRLVSATGYDLTLATLLGSPRDPALDLNEGNRRLYDVRSTACLAPPGVGAPN